MARTSARGKHLDGTAAQGQHVIGRRWAVSWWMSTFTAPRRIPQLPTCSAVADSLLLMRSAEELPLVQATRRPLDGVQNTERYKEESD